MPRAIAGTVAILAALLLLTSFPLSAQDAGPWQGAYLPLALVAPPTPTPEPTATPLPATPTAVPPPAINTTVLRLSDFISGWVQTEADEVTNEEAVKVSQNPTAARKAFVTQGRETSYYVLFENTERFFRGAVAVADQTVRYTTADGAASGWEYTITDKRTDRDTPGFQDVAFKTFGDRSLAMRREFTSDGYNWTHYAVVIRQGRYVTTVQAIGLRGFISASETEAYATRTMQYLPK